MGAGNEDRQMSYRMTHLVLPEMNTVWSQQSDLGAWCEYMK
jgi:hypothetical protein